MVDLLVIILAVLIVLSLLPAFCRFTDKEMDEENYYNARFWEKGFGKNRDNNGNKFEE